MITKYNKFNESIKSLLVGPTKDEVWENLGYDRTFDTPEEFLLYRIDGMKIKEQVKYPNIIFWEKDGKIIFEQDFGNMDLCVNDITIWSVLEKGFGLVYDEMQLLIEKFVEEHLNWKGFSPNYRYSHHII